MSFGNHTVQLTIDNHSGVDMHFNDLVYKHGMVDDFSQWPRVIPNNSEVLVKSKERSLSVLGVSGYAVYEMSGTMVTIAFSCPPVGASKVNAGLGSNGTVYEEMTDTDYKEFGVQIKVGPSKVLNVVCQAGRSLFANECSVKFHPSRD